MRMYYEATTTLSGMWYGNPVLTSVIIGLPMGFLSLICYSMWCADIMDASEDEPGKRFLKTCRQSFIDLITVTNSKLAFLTSCTRKRRLKDISCQAIYSSWIL